MNSQEIHLFRCDNYLFYDLLLYHGLFSLNEYFIQLIAEPAKVILPLGIKIAYNLLSELPNIHRNFRNNRSSRFVEVLLQNIAVFNILEKHSCGFLNKSFFFNSSIYS